MAKEGNSKAQYIIQHQHLHGDNWNRLTVEHEHGAEVVFIETGWLIKNPLSWLKREFERWMLENDESERNVFDSFKAYVESRPHQLLNELHEQFGPALPESLGASIEESEEVRTKFYAELLGELINGLLNYYKKRASILGMFDEDEESTGTESASIPLDSLLN